MTKTAAPMGDWWLAASSQQQSCSWTVSCAEYFGDTSNDQVTQTPDSQDMAPCDFLLFPKLKSPLKGRRFQTIDEIQENTAGLLMVIGRTVCGPKVTTLKETEASLSYVQCFFYVVSSSVNICIFHSAWLDTFWTHIYIHTHTHTHKVKSSFSTCAHSSTLSLAARLHWCCANCSHYTNNCWTFSGNTHTYSYSYNYS